MKLLRLTLSQAKQWAVIGGISKIMMRKASYGAMRKSKK
jgi:hypothetical protein